MSYESLRQLEPKLYGERMAEPQRSLELVDRLVPLPASYRQWLASAGGAIVFTRGAIFKTEETSPLNDKRGYQSLEILYGLGDGDNSILQEYARYKDELPATFVPIGEAPGGNLVCINEHGIVYLWNHEGPTGNSYWRICGDIDSFLSSLEPDDSPLGDTDGIIESESWLDF